MTNHSVGQAVPSLQPPPEAAPPPAQPGAWVCPSSSSTEPTTAPTADPLEVVDPWAEAERRYASDEGRASDLGFYFNQEEKAAAEERNLQLVGGLSKREEWIARAEFAKLERAKLTTGASRAPLADPSTITLEFAMATDTATVKLEFLLDPFLPAGCVVCFAGRGGTAKSSFLATMAAHISARASTLWVSVEEPAEWIRVRHIKSGGIEKSLLAWKADGTNRDEQGRVVGSDFNIYQHLEPAIQQAKMKLEGGTPLRLIVLDTAVGLTAWAKGESPNDDAAVKKLLSYLQGLAEIYALTIAFISHSNKGKHDHFADTVAGASAWTNSPRLSFVHARDRREEHAYVMRVAKSNLTQAFAVPYKTAPIHVLQEREEGADSVLCHVLPGTTVWGEEQSMTLYEDATKKPRDDDDSGGGGMRPASLTDTVVAHVAEMVSVTTEPVTRDMVQQRLGRQVDGRTWTKVEAQLLLNAFIYGVSVERALNNQAIYARTTTPVVPPVP